MTRRYSFIPLLTLVFLMLMSLLPVQTKADGLKIDMTNVVLEVGAVPDHGLLVLPVDLAPVLSLSRLPLPEFAGLTVRCQNTEITSQFVPNDPTGKGFLVLQFTDSLIKKSQEQTLACRLEFLRADAAHPALIAAVRPVEKFDVERPDFIVTHTAAIQGGFPSKIVYKGTGHTYDKMAWVDRVHHPEFGGWNLAWDKKAKLELLSSGPVCTALRQTAVFSNSAGQRHSATPQGCYTWLYFKEKPVIYVTADYTAEKPCVWRELHFGELQPRGCFTHWTGTAPDEDVAFTKSLKSSSYKKGAAMRNGTDAIIFYGNALTVYDHGTAGSSYLLMDRSFAWQEWNGTRRSNSGWIRVGQLPNENKKKYENIAAGITLKESSFTQITIPSLANSNRWQTAAAGTALLDGIASNVEEANLIDKLMTGKRNGNYLALESKDLALLLKFRSGQKKEEGQGVSLAGLFDRNGKCPFGAKKESSLFTLSLRELDVKNTPSVEKTITSLDGWNKIDVDCQNDSCRMTLTGNSQLTGAENLTVELVFKINPQKTGIEGTMNYRYDNKKYSLMTAVWPAFSIRSFGDRMKGFYPTGPGIVYDRPIAKRLRLRQIYPTGFGATMAWMAAWNDVTRQGLYFGYHTPLASTKYLLFQTEDDSLQWGFEHPVPNRTLPGNSWTSPGTFSLRAFHGDWFDAALIYRDWVRKNAKWYPKLGPNGRPDTPQWVKELSLWAIGGGADPKVVPEQMKKFKQAFGVPGGLHWYNWHKIPFDNDYPHFLPARDGFKEAVLEIQKEGDFHVMPYINGRLWDTRDREMDDWKFTSEGFAGVSKKEDGTPFIETYHSTEKDGQKVKLGAMCPSTPVWKNKVREVVLRLMNECDVDGVYIDQVAAAGPTLCMDAKHGHTLGGGQWWCPSYWDMLERLRTDMKKEVTDYPLCKEERDLLAVRPDHLKNRMITTECNAEPYTNVFDSYLTWHWQFQDAVPAFSAVYGGAVQMFGRSYAGNAMAWRMKAAESLVFGEQIGWFSFTVINDPAKLDYIRPLVRFRQNVVRYFYQGEMARPVRFLDKMPTITEDWQWSGHEKIVTTDVVRTGTWRILNFEKSRQNRTKTKSVLFIFTNLSKESVESRIDFSLEELGLKTGQFELRRIDSEGRRSEPLPEKSLTGTIHFPAGETWGYELTP